MFAQPWRPILHVFSRLLQVILVSLVAAGLLVGLTVILPTTATASAQTTASASSTTNQQGSTTVDVKNAAGIVAREDVFARGPNDTLAHRWRTVGTHAWTPWKLLDLHLNSAPVAIQNPDPLHRQGVIHVFYNTEANSDHSPSIERIGLDLGGNMVFHENLYSRGCKPPSIIGFCAPKHFGVISAPAVVSRGQLSPGYYHEEVFALEGSHTMVHRWVNFGNVWSDWQVLSTANFVGNPTAISLGPHRMDVFIRSFDNHIYDKVYDENVYKSGWAPSWQDLGGNFQFYPTVTSLTTGSMTVFAVPSGSNTISRRTFSNGSWGPWVVADPANSAGGTIAASPPGFNGQMDLFVPDSGGFLWLRSMFYNGNNAETQLLGGGTITSAPAALVGAYPT